MSNDTAVGKQPPVAAEPGDGEKPAHASSSGKRRRRRRSEFGYLDQWYRRERMFKVAVFLLIGGVVAIFMFYAMNAASNFPK